MRDCLIFSGQASVRVILDGKDSECTLKCIYLVHSDEQAHINFEVIHKSDQTTSTQLVRGLATDKAKAFFSGRIRIPYDSQKCYAVQNHRGILLSEQASVTAIPELEIYADDVKCSHGSAIGPIDNNQLFYLLSRGIDEKSAYKILITAFVFDLVPQEYQSIVQEWIDEHI